MALIMVSSLPHGSYLSSIHWPSGPVLISVHQPTRPLALAGLLQSTGSLALAGLLSHCLSPLCP